MDYIYQVCGIVLSVGMPFDFRGRGYCGVNIKMSMPINRETHITVYAPEDVVQAAGIGGAVSGDAILARVAGLWSYVII